MPELETPRLRLRALGPEDAAGVLQVLGDDEVTRYHSMPTLTTLEEAHAALAQLQRRYQAEESLRWAIEVAGRPGLIGTVGLLHVSAEHRRGELGYELARAWWGQGVMTEAARAVVTYAFERLGLHRIEAGVLVGNDRSVRVLQKLGFHEEGTLRAHLQLEGQFQDVRWFSLLPTDV